MPPIPDPVARLGPLSLSALAGQVRTAYLGLLEAASSMETGDNSPETARILARLHRAIGDTSKITTALVLLASERRWEDKIVPPSPN